MRTIPLICRPDAIPESINVDLTGLEIGDGCHISMVKLPDGVEPTITDRDFTIATIAAPSGLKSQQDEDADDAEEVAADEVPSIEVSEDD
jgi:large subunit ribosomal protein L25